MKKRNLVVVFLLLFCSFVYGQDNSIDVKSITGYYPQIKIEYYHYDGIRPQTAKQITGKYIVAEMGGTSGSGVNGNLDICSASIHNTDEIYIKNSSKTIRIFPCTPQGLIFSRRDSTSANGKVYRYYFVESTKPASSNYNKLYIKQVDKETGQIIDGGSIGQVGSTSKIGYYFCELPGYVLLPKNYLGESYRATNLVAPIGYKKAAIGFVPPFGSYTLQNEKDVIPLQYSEDGGATIMGDYEGVRIGEYLWMNSSFRNHVMKSVTYTYNGGKNIDIEQYRRFRGYILETWNPYYDNRASYTTKTIAAVDYSHQWYRMFQYYKKDEITPSHNYWDQIEGASNAEKVNLFDKSYGIYHSRAHMKMMDWYSNRIYMLENDANGNRINKGWNLPTEADVLQLFGMCGNVTNDEAIQYLSYWWQDPSAPQMATINVNQTYFNWFNPAAINFDSESNGYNVNNMHRYKFNLFPTGDRFNGPGQLDPVHHDQTGTQPVNLGDFNGLNQQATIPTQTGFGRIHDYVEVFSGEDYHLMPIRWCRALTDEELGYRLYINILDYNESIANFEKYYQDHINGTKEVIIKKILISDTAPSSNEFIELPRGFLRGLYVQYMIEYPDGKIIEDILRISQQNKHLWKGNSAKTIVRKKNAVARIEDDAVNADILQVEIYDLRGQLQVRSTQKEEAVSSLKAGTYIVKETTATGVNTYKIIRE